MTFNKILKLIQILRVKPYRIRLLTNRVAAGVEHSPILRSLCQLKTVVDIGANRGQFSLVSRFYFPNAKIISFEPLKEQATIFRRVFSSDSRVALHELAIGPEDTNTTIHVSRADDSSSLLPITSLQSKLFPGTEEKEVRSITVKRLDSVLEPEDVELRAFLKIDVQGFEKEALQGCQSLLGRFSYVYVECSFVELYTGQALAHEVISLLEQYGFALSGIYNLCYDKKGIAIQGDFLFSRKI